jgi:acetyl esterase/lipase
VSTDWVGALVVVLVAGSALAGSPHEPYYVRSGEEEPRWYVAPEEGPLTGSQNGWFVGPGDLLPGSFGFVGELLAVDSTTIEFRHTRCVRAKYTYRLERMEGESDMQNRSEKLRRKPFISTSRAKWADLADAGETAVRIVGTMREVIKPARAFEVDLIFADREVPVRMEVVEAQDNPNRPPPDVRGLRYGPHWKHGMDIYYPEERGDDPLPAIVNIHGGGWGARDKASVAGDAVRWNEEGFAFVAISYRYVSMAEQYPAVEPPVAAPLLDAARAIQMLRYRASELGIDPARFGFTGGSAGAATSLWLALHDDLADPESDDPVSRMSTKPQCVVAVQAQTSLDPLQMREWIPPVTYGVHAFFPSSAGKAPREREEAFEFWLSKRDEISPWIKQFSPAEHVSPDDPPVLLNYLDRTIELPGNPTHHPRFGLHLHGLLREAGVESYFVYGEQDFDEKYGTWAGVKRFLIDHLKP